MKTIKYFFLAAIALLCTVVTLSSCSKDDSNGVDIQTSYDVLQINGENYACYGYRSAITYTTSWNLQKHSGKLLLPCGKLSDAQKGEYDYDYMFDISLKGNQDLQKGSKLEAFSPTFVSSEDLKNFAYVSGSATITDKQDDEYITVTFDSFKFSNSSKSYVLNGTVQLDLDED